MTLFEIVALYVALNLILALVLAGRVVQLRLKGKVSLGDNGDSALRARIRAHGNFTENAPLALIGLFSLASLSVMPWVLHLFGGGFILGRVLHAIGMSTPGATGQTRRVGMTLTILCLLGTAVTVLYKILAA